MKSVLFIWLCAAMAVQAGAGILKNADWSQKSGNAISSWIPKPADAVVKSDNGVLTLKSGGLVIQDRLPLEKGKTYIFAAEFSASEGGRAMLYCDYRRTGGKLRSYHSRPFAVSKKWGQKSFRFTVPDNFVHGALIVRAPEKPLMVRNISVTEMGAIKTEGVLKNPDWSVMENGIPVAWAVRPADSSIVSAKDGVLHLKSLNKDQIVLIIQNDLPMNGGTVYQAECRIKSASKSDVMFYVEYRDATGRLRAANAVWRKTIPSWERHTFTVKLPEKIQGKPYIVLRPAKGGEAEFTELSLKELAKPQEIPLTGGTLRGIVESKSPVKVVLENTPHQQIAAEHRDIPITPGTNCVYNFSIRGEGKSGHNTGFHFYRADVVLPDGSIRTSGWDDTWNDRKQFKTIKFIVPEDKANTSMKVRFYANSKGRMILEDFKVACNAIDPAENYYFVLNSPVSRDTFFGTAENMVCAGMVNAYSAPQADSVRLKDAAGNIIKSSRISWNGKLTTKFELPLGKLANGAYTLELVQNNQVLIRRNIKVLPVVKNMVTSNSRNQILLDGKPFFVNLIWWNPPNYGDNIKSLKQLADNGITATLVTGVDSEAIVKCLNNCREAGIKAMIHVPLAYILHARKHNLPKTDGQLVPADFIGQLVTDEIKNHPALLGYHLIDEPMWGGIPVEPILATYNKLREADPYHPVWINAAPRGEVAGHRIYSGASDWYGLDIYPVPAPTTHSNLDDRNITSVGKYTQRMVEAVNDRKPVIMTLQAFSWTSLAHRRDKNFKSDGKGYPNVEELRFMSFDAFTSGAAGLAWWGSHYVRYKKFFTDYMQVMRELYELSGILGAGQRSPAVEKNGIRYCDYTSGGCKLYVVMNVTDKPQTAILPDFAGGKALDFYSKGNVTAQSKVEFAPYTVKVYITGQLPDPAYKLPVTGGEATEYIKRAR